MHSLAQDALHMTAIGQLTYDESLSDVRGAVHNGREYALVGVFNGFSIVDVSDPSSPFEVFFVEGGNSIWRDPFYNNGFAYCVNETSGGLLIVDMSPLPEPGTPPAVTNLPVSYFTGDQYPWTTAHNISFDEQNRGYIYGSSYGVGGVIILDFSQSATQPTELGVWDEYYVHDGFVRGDTLWASCVNDGFSAVVDISNPAAPQTLTTWNTPSNFSHNIWPSDDNSTVFTTDEVSSGYIAAYDVTDLSNVVELDRVNEPLSPLVIPHNAHYFNGYIVTSHYRDGLTVHDASDPSNIILTGYYDSSPLEGEGFNGAWGAWPYLPSGIILVSDIEEGLFTIQPEYVRAARIEGTVRNAGSGVQLSGVNVTISSIAQPEVTGIEGRYASGTATAGLVDVSFVRGGFLPLTVEDVELVNGEVTVLDVELTPDVPFTLEVTVTDPEGMPVDEAIVTLKNSLFDIEATTDGSGIYENSDFYDGTYEVTVGKWGYRTECGTFTLNEGQSTLSFVLAMEYYDDFALDFGWQVSGSATTGIWERGAPIATFFENNTVNPGSDSGEGCGNFAFVTGNAGPPVQIDDVDDGETVLKSPPIDLNRVGSIPVLSFSYWFFTGGGNSPSNDEMLVKVYNGVDMATMGSLPNTEGNWQTADFIVSEHIALTDTIWIEFFIQDAPPGHLVEGGIDQFSITQFTGVGEQTETDGFLIFPNPSNNGSFTVSLKNEADGASVCVFDLSGRVVIPSRQISSRSTTLSADLPQGVYLVEVMSSQARSVKRLVISR
jgi:choice-of-anchor B domain-containing protein